MSEQTKKSEPATIGQLLAHYFQSDNPEHLAENLMRSWVVVLSNLDQDTNSHFTLSRIGLISKFLLDFEHMTTSSCLTIDQILPSS